MLRSLETMIHQKLRASDGDIGEVSDFYFDDARWVIRYLVADCGGFFSERRVLISPMAFAENATEKQFHVALTRERIKNSPSVDLTKPVSRQHEREFLQYYGWPYYGGSGMWGIYDYPQMQLNTVAIAPDTNNDPHLRSIAEVQGYHVEVRDGEIGHVQDFIWDDRSWAIRYVVVDTSNWWTGRQVLVAPQWITEINWAEKKIHIDLPREVIKFSPEWKPKAAIDRRYEEELHRYYARPAYWVEEERRRNEKTSPAQEILAEHR